MRLATVSLLAKLYSVAGFICQCLGLRKLQRLCSEAAKSKRQERLQQLEQARKRSEEARKRLEEAEKLKQRIADATPEELAALWKAGKLDARDYNKSNPRKSVPRGPSPSEPGFYVGSRGGRYRINSSGRKSYDVP